jgi:dolichyl-phosphate beta-glucosyltransferase
MDQPVFFTLILPAYNEVKTIGQTIIKARSYLEQKGFSYEIIVSADGGDGTRELVAELAKSDPSLSVIGGPERRGKGYAIRRAVPLSKGQIVGFADADDKTPIEELDKFLPWFERGYDLVIGSRALSGSKIEKRQPWYRQLGSRGFGVAMHLIVGLHEVPDTQCGFKFFRREIALDLFRRQKIDGYMYDVEILYLAEQAGYRLKQIGIRWKDDGDSRLMLVRGNIRNGLDLFRIRFRHTKNKQQVYSGQPMYSDPGE